MQANGNLDNEEYFNTERLHAAEGEGFSVT
jgi:hypothetical protein